MRFKRKLILIAHILLSHFILGLAVKKEKSSKEALPITITGSGIDELHKGDVAMIFYITVTTQGSDAVHLFVNSTRCCQKFEGSDQDCDSMRPLGGDMGKLYPGDYRNLTLVYTNLYLHERAGECDIEIRSSEGVTMSREVPFNTKLIRDTRTHIPRVLKQYYDLDDLVDCKKVDENPLDQCRPYECDMRYDGTRNYYNHTSNRCEVVPQCLPGRDKSMVAYVVETNSCKTLRNAMREDDFLQFRQGKPAAYSLVHAHGYPINVQCHNGQRDSEGKWCKCNIGWESAPFDHKVFNPNVQVYHMCTVWTGELSAEEARNTTVAGKSPHGVTNAVVFSLLGVAFFLLCGLLIFVLWEKRKAKSSSDLLDLKERLGLTEDTSDSEE